MSLALLPFLVMASGPWHLEGLILWRTFSHPSTYKPVSVIQIKFVVCYCHLTVISFSLISPQISSNLPHQESKKDLERSTDRGKRQALLGVSSWKLQSISTTPLNWLSLGQESLNKFHDRHQTHPEALPSLRKSHLFKVWPKHLQCPVGVPCSGLQAQLISHTLAQSTFTLAEL